LRFFKLTLSYDGSAYAGWQVQAQGRTVQAELEHALLQITGQRIRAVASGRTDAGVHALGQVVSFAAKTRLSADVLRRAIDAHLPEDIVVRDVADAPEGFHAIRDAIRKRYRYVIQDGPVRDVFARKYAWQLSQHLDAEAMRAAAVCLTGRHDYSSFEAAGSPRASPVRTVDELLLERRHETAWDRLVIEIEADGFLYNMVRNIVGTLVEVGRGKRPPAWVAEVLAAKNRRLAGMTAPPQGLFLVHVEYPSCESLTSSRG
jgi:tRNA pseudouridine38-40 synthase